MRMFLLFVFAAVALAAPAFAEPARAAAQIPWGDFVADSGAALAGVGVALASAVIASLSAPLRFALLQFRADRMIAAAIQSAVNRTAGAQAGKVLTLDLGNAVANRAVEYIAGRAMGFVREVGGIQRLKEMILARLSLDEAAVIEPPAAVVK
jgi:hypothetical protein